VPTDSSFASSKTSYAIEGFMVLRMTDRCKDIANNAQLDASCFNGVAHPLMHQGKKAKRINHGTSHAESLANYTGITGADMAALRLTELHWPLVTTPSLKELIDVESTGQYDVPIDTMTDCFDLFELVTGSKGIPQDKSQRLIVMSLQERRMMLRTRCYIWVNTNAMLANGLTKTMSDDPLLATMQESGILRIDGPATIRWSTKVHILDETAIETLRE